MPFNYRAANIVPSYFEVDANDNFFREMKEAAGTDGAHITDISRPLPIQGDGGQFNKSKYFVVFSGNGDNADKGRPNEAQRDVLKNWGAKSFPDLESFQIGKKVATDIALEVQTAPSTAPYEAFAQPAPD